MCLTIHDILAEIPVSVTSDDTLTITVRIEYNYLPPRGREPADLARRSAIMVGTEGPEPTDEQVNEWAQDWLDCEGYDAACNRAEEQRGGA